MTTDMRGKAVRQPSEPTGNPLDYRCPTCGLFPGRQCITSRGKPHKRRVEVASGGRAMVPDDAPDNNAWLGCMLLEGIAANQSQVRSRLRKARLPRTMR